jgi:hypothetical protein
MSADGGLHATRDHNDVRHVMQNTKTVLGWPIIKKWIADIQCSAPHDTEPFTLEHSYNTLTRFEEWRLLGCYACGSCKNRRFGGT